MSVMTNILIVDDNQDLVKYMQMFLIGRGFEVSIASKVAEALDKIGQDHFDAMVIGVSLKGFSGLSLLKSLKNRGDVTPVIMMSAYATLDMAEECLNHGAYDFLFKPFRLEVLADILEGIKKRNQRLSKMGVIS